MALGNEAVLKLESTIRAVGNAVIALERSLRVFALSDFPITFIMEKYCLSKNQATALLKQHGDKIGYHYHPERGKRIRIPGDAIVKLEEIMRGGGRDVRRVPVESRGKES